jgi:RNA polymerase subunit RPABC4/transcription elongation factor Spt4
MATQSGLFKKNKQCEYCGRPLPQHYELDVCPHCMDANLFREVKDYIRSNHVNEYQVAEHFGISIKQVKQWIREGRIEYRTNDPSGTLTGIHCQRCGAPVTFGSLCPECLKLLNTGSGTAVKTVTPDVQMHYLDKNKH